MRARHGNIWHGTDPTDPGTARDIPAFAVNRVAVTWHGQVDTEGYDTAWHKLIDTEHLDTAWYGTFGT